MAVDTAIVELIINLDYRHEVEITTEVEEIITGIRGMATEITEVVVGLTIIEVVGDCVDVSIGEDIETTGIAGELREKG